MEKSILEFQKNGIPALEKVILRFFEDPTKLAEFVGDVQNNVLQFALNIIAEQFEAIDEKLRNSGRRKKNWEIVKRDEKTLTTSIGDLTFEKTLFRNKKTGEYRYLADEILGLEKHERMTEDAEAKMYKEAAESSYRKAGEEMSILSGMSKQTVMNKLTLPSDEVMDDRYERVAFILTQIARNESTMELFGQIANFLMQYPIHKKQLIEQMKAQFEPILREKEAKMKEQYGESFHVSLEQDKEFLEILKKNLERLDEQYNATLQDAREQLKGCLA
jgi:hypothetical protein